MSGKHYQSDADWLIEKNSGNDKFTMEQAHLAVLMDIRRELKLVNEKLSIQYGYTRSVRDELKQVNRRLLKAGYKAK